MSALPAIPDPSAVDIAAVKPFCEQLVLWAQTSDDAEQLRDARDRLSAIDKYAQQRNLEGRNEIAAAMRRIEARIGELLNAAGEQRGGRPDRGSKSKRTPGDPLPKGLAKAARKMANHPDVVDQVIADSTDEEPATRKKVLDAIDPPKDPDLVEVRIKLLVGDAERARRLALAADHHTLSDWVGSLVQRALRGVAGEGENRVGATNQSTTSPSRPERRARPTNPKAAHDEFARSLGLHDHVAGKMLSGGIHPCIEKGCMARKVNGSWVEVS